MNIREEINKLEPLNLFLYERSFVSGREQKSFKVTYYFNKTTKHLYASVLFTDDAQGPPNHVHGGVTAAILDEALGGAAWLNGFPVVTAQLTLNFKKPIKISTEIFVDSWVDNTEDKKVYLKGIVVDENESLYAEASGIFLIQKLELFKKMGDLPDDYFEKVMKNLNINFLST